MPPENRDAAHLWDMLAAAHRVSPQTRASMPDIPWRSLIGLRNLLAHEYGRIDASMRYRTATQNLPAPVATLERMTRSGG